MRMWPYVPAAALVDSLDDFVGEEPEPQCWLEGDGADAALSYCMPCAEAQTAEGKGDFIGGGYEDRRESDSCEHCDVCGKLLSYSLTRFGGDSELEHFLSVKGTDQPPSRDVAYHIARMLEAKRNEPEALRIAEIAVAQILRMQA